MTPASECRDVALLCRARACFIKAEWCHEDEAKMRQILAHGVQAAEAIAETNESRAMFLERVEARR